MKTERLVILVTRQEKQAINARAKSLNMSTSEIVRRAVDNYRPNERHEEEVLERLATELEASTKETRKALRAAQKELNETLAYFADKRNKLAKAS